MPQSTVEGRPRRPRLRVAGVALAVAAFGWTIAAHRGGAPNHLAAGDGVVVPASQRPTVPALRMPGLDHSLVSLTDPGSSAFTLVNFWGSWCGPCRAEEPALSRLSRTYAGRIRFVGVDIRDDRARADAFRRAYKIPYPSLFDPANRVSLSLGSYQPATTPATLLIDASGHLAARITGPVLYTELRAALDRALRSEARR